MEGRAPGVGVGEGPAGREGEGGPGGLADVVDAGVGAHAVARDPRRVEALLVAAHAVLVDREPGEQALEGAAVLGVPVQAREVVLGQPLLLEHPLVVHHRDGVVVLRDAVALPVLAGPQLLQAVLEAVGGDVGQRREIVQRCDHAEADELREARQVVGEGVGAGTRDEARGELRPVVVPAQLGDPHEDVGVLGHERIDRGGVGGQLVRVPQPVVDLGGAGRGGARPAGAERDGARGACGQRRRAREEPATAQPSRRGAGGGVGGREGKAVLCHLGHLT